jgi:hypothetical protein
MRIRELKLGDTANGMELAMKINNAGVLNGNSSPMVIVKAGGRNIAVKDVEVVRRKDGETVVVLKA